MVTDLATGMARFDELMPFLGDLNAALELHRL